MLPQNFQNKKHHRWKIAVCENGVASYSPCSDHYLQSYIELQYMRMKVEKKLDSWHLSYDVLGIGLLHGPSNSQYLQETISQLW
jgi:hypothetical protein